MRLALHCANVGAALLYIGCVTTGVFLSVTSIEPGKTFLLGGDQTDAFAIHVRNTGRVPVIVYAERNRQRDSVTTLRPSGELDAEFPARTIAVFRNGSVSRQATITLANPRGATTNLGMRYKPDRD